jgi:hypothetical protein
MAGALSDPEAAARVASQHAIMAASAAEGGEPIPDAALATTVAFRESGPQMFISNARGNRSAYVDVFGDSGMEALGSFFAREREAGRLNESIPDSVTRTWELDATLTSSEFLAAFSARFPGISNPCRAPEARRTEVTQFLSDNNFICNEARNTVFPQLRIPPEHLVIAATALLNRAGRTFNERAAEFHFEGYLSGLSSRARRFWTQLFFAKPGRTPWGTSDSRVVGPHAFMQRLQQLQEAGRIPAGVNPLEFAVTWPEFLSYTTARRALVTAQEAEMVEATLTGICP